MSKNTSSKNSQNKRRIVASSYRVLRKGERFLPPLLRGLMGLLLVFGGILGFLPILGFWMIPLGLALLATDIPPLRHWLIKRLNASRRNNGK